MKTITKLFLICAFLTLLSMATLNANAFIVFASLANVFGIWAIVKSFKTGEI